jgi:hypothetical protein
MATNQRGRPPKDKKDTVPHGYSFRLADAENDKMQELIRQSGLSESEFIRRAVVRNETTVIEDWRAKQKSNPDMRRLLFLVAKTSNNCNQIAHSLNIARHANPGITTRLVELMLAELLEITSTLKDFI